MEKFQDNLVSTSKGTTRYGAKDLRKNMHFVVPTFEIQLTKEEPRNQMKRLSK